jgi:hypothetical protein
MGAILPSSSLTWTGGSQRWGEAIKEVVGCKADVVIASGAEIALKSALAATDALPIVMIATNYDPIALGYVCSNSSNCRCGLVRYLLLSPR